MENAQSLPNDQKSSGLDDTVNVSPATFEEPQKVDVPDITITNEDSDMELDYVESENKDDEYDYYINVFSARPGNFENYIATGQSGKPEKYFKVSLGIQSDILQYLGPVLRDMISESESNNIDLNIENNVDYQDNLVLLLKFIRNVSLQFSDEEMEQLTDYSNKYHKVTGSNPTVVKLVKCCFPFAREHDIVPKKGQYLNIKHMEKIHDFGCLCEFLKIDIGILAAAFWIKTISRSAAPLQINDILDIPASTHEDNIYRAQKIIYFLKYPCCVLEPTREMLKNINVDIDPDNDIDFQIDYIKQQFIEEQNVRFRKFNDELGAYDNPSDDEIMELAKESDSLNEDDIRRIDYEFKKKRYMNFHQDVLSKEHELNHKLNKSEFLMMKDDSPYLHPDEKAGIDEDNEVIHLYKMIVKEYEKENCIEREQ